MSYNGGMKNVCKVLFLCSGNYYRSRFAEIVFNARAATAGLNWRAESRGLCVEQGNLVNVGPISTHALEGLRRRGIVPESAPRSPLALRAAELEEFDLVVALKAEEHRPMLQAQFPKWAERVRYWDVHDVDLCAPEEAMAEIERLVEALIKELQSRQGAARG